MAYSFSSNLDTIYLATALDTRKSDNMRSRPGVSLLWDNRTGKVSDHEEGRLVSASAEAEFLGRNGDLKIVEAKSLLLSKNPNFGDFLDGDSVGFFAVKVDAYEVVVGYGKPVVWMPKEEGKE